MRALVSKIGQALDCGEQRAHLRVHNEEEMQLPRTRF
jgi:hypothetical protein